MRKYIAAFALAILLAVPSVGFAQVELDGSLQDFINELEVIEFDGSTSFPGLESPYGNRGITSQIGPEQIFTELFAELARELDFPEDLTPKKIQNAFKGIFAVASVLILFITSLILTSMFKKPSSAIINETQKNFWMDLLIGLGVFFLTPIIGILLLITLVGSSLAVLVAALYFILLILGKIAGVLFIGALIWNLFDKKSKKLQVNWKTILIGTLTFVIIGFIPILGWLAALVVQIAGIGAVSGYMYRELWLKRERS